ncbi:MAG: RNA polymerase subunit sigma-24, partial [Pseudolysinimonas sp.]
PDHLTGWVYSIAAGVLANHRRSIARRSRLSVKLRDELRDSESDDGVLDLRLDIAAAVDKLDPQSAELVRLIYWDRLSATDAGAVLGLSGSGARAKAAAARATLADLLTRYPGSQ